MAAGKKLQVGLQVGSAGLVVGAFLWAFWPTFTGLAGTWSRDPNYSQGYLVPGLALAILWHRWRAAPRAQSHPDLWGVFLLLGATALRLAGAYYYVTPLDHLSLLLTLAAVCLLVGGRAWLVVAWPAIAFLLFMIPIPRSLGGTALIAGLQEVATASSTFTLQTLGFVAQQEGNVILLKDAQLGIVEACSGLRMLMVFCSLATATAILLPYGWKRRTLLVVSAVPLAVACNVVRITVAGIASETLSTEAGHFVFHDLAGWLMIPLAFALLGGEIFLLSKLFQGPSARRPALGPADRLAAPRQALPSVGAGKRRPHGQRRARLGKG
jgi:exosortase